MGRGRPFPKRSRDDASGERDSANAGAAGRRSELVEGVTVARRVNVTHPRVVSVSSLQVLGRRSQLLLRAA